MRNSKMPGLEQPDSGYAWVVAAAACLINMILAGMSRMSGLLYVAVIDVYGVTREEASGPFIVRNLIRNLSGPVVSGLGQRFGIRPVTFCGGILASLGSVLCCLAPSVDYLTILWGVVHGFGYSLSNILFQVVVNQYFERHRASATGIVLSGACLGSFVFPFMIEGLLDEWGLFGCFLMLGGLFLNVSPLALLLRSPPWVKDPDGYSRKRLSEKSCTQLHQTHPIEHSTTGSRDGIQSLKEDSGTHANSVHKLSVVGDVHTSGVPCSNSQLSFGKFSSTYNNEGCTDRDNVMCTSYSSHSTCFENDNVESSCTKENTGNVANRNIEIPETKCSKSSNPTETLSKKPPSKKEHTSFLEIMKNILHLYKSAIFWHISISFAIFNWVYIVVLTVVIDYSRDKNVPTKLHNYLIYALTIGDLVGRLSFGWVTDRKVMSFSSFVALSFFLQGIFVALFPVVSSIWTYIMIITLYGIASGVLFIYFPMLVHRYMDKDSQTIAIGSYSLVSGITAFAISPVIGPLVSVLGQRYGIREVTCIGGVIASLGSVLCCGAPSVLYITLSWGFIHGFGFSLSNTLFQVVVNQYFERLRASATGIILSGACLGSFGFPFMIEGFLNEWGLFGCFLMLGGLFLNVSPLALLLRSPPWVTDPEGYAKKRSLMEERNKISYVQSGTISSTETSQEPHGFEKESALESNNIYELRIVGDSSRSVESASDFQFPFQGDALPHKKGTSTIDVQESSESKDHNEIPVHGVNGAEIPYITREVPKKPPSKQHTSILEGLKDILHLYKSLIFWHISISFAVFGWIFLVVMTVVIDYSSDKNIPVEFHNYLIYALTIGDLVGRLSFGWVTDRKVMSFSSFVALSFFLQGVFLCLFPIAASFWTYLVIITLYGVSSGVLFIYFPVLVHRYIDEESQTVAMGCYGLISGITTFGLPAIIGLFRDNVGSYDGLFYISGIVSIVTGGAWLLEPLIINKG